MDNKIKTMVDATSIGFPNKMPRRSHYARIVQNFHLVWLDGSIDDNHNIVAQLRHVVGAVNTFSDIDECMDFITDIKDKNIFMIVSETFSKILVPIVQDISQVSSVYIFSQNKIRHEQWSKVKGVSTDITSIREALEHTAYECDQNLVSISFATTNDRTSNKNLDQLDQSFMYTQILKEILLTIDFKEEHINEFVTYYREQSVDNIAELKHIDKIEKEYHHYKPIWWYTYNHFLYSTVNRALRTMEIDLIIKMGFFVRDLHQHITEHHFEQYADQHYSTTFTVYRCQPLSQTNFNRLMENKGGLMSFNNFLSTSLNRSVSLLFSGNNQSNKDLVNVLFQINVDSSISTTPFANIRDASLYEQEEEILFSMHSVFRIEQIKQIDRNNRLWQVDLVSTSDNDPQLYALTERMREETFPHKTGWYRLGEVLIKIGDFNKSQQVYQVLLNQTWDDREKANIYNQLGWIKNNQGEYVEAIEFYQKSIQIKQRILPPIDTKLASAYINISLAYEKMSEYSKAQSYYEKALEIFQKTLPLNHSHWASFYNNMGLLYDKRGEYPKALSYYEKALEIFQKTLPLNHPHLAMSYNNIGWEYEKMGEYEKALLTYTKVLETYQKVLPPNHPDWANFYKNIGLLYDKMGKYLEALSYYEKALEIYQKVLPPNRLDLADCYNNIGLVYDNMGEYSKALSFHEKSFQIYQENLPSNHPHLAASYVCHGSVYTKIGNYSNALSYFEKALEIYQKTLPTNHPHIATCYNNIASVYNKMGGYEKALPLYEKALEICKKTLLPDHPYLAATYNNIAQIYFNMYDYSSAFSFIQHAVNIGQCSLPEKHPDLQNYKADLEMIKNKL